MDYFFYALKSKKNNSIYKGISDDPNRREKEHNQGRNRSTKSGVPWELFYVEVYSNRIEARKKEKYYKSGIGRETLKELLNIIDNPV
jgi:putative endonuclease